MEESNGRGLGLRMREMICWLLDVRGSSGTSAREPARPEPATDIETMRGRLKWWVRSAETMHGDKKIRQ